MVDEMDGRVLDPSSPLHAVVAMPHLRRLASQGALFVNTYVTSPQCVPSRTTMSVGLRSHMIGMWDQSRGIVAVDGDPTRLDHYCLDHYGEATCRQWAQDQRAPPTFFDEANRSAVNVSIIGKLHIGAGLDRYAAYAPANETTNGWPFIYYPPYVKAGKHYPGWSSGRYWTREALIDRPVPGQNINRSLTTVTDIMPAGWSGPMVPTDYLTVELCRRALAEGRLARSATQQQLLYCSILAPHPPYYTNQTYLDMIDTALITKAEQVRLEEVSFADHMMTQDMQVRALSSHARPSSPPPPQA